MAKNGRYLVGQKFTNEQMELILYGYAAWATPAEVMETAERFLGKSISAKAIYNIFGLTRKRLLALNVFPDPARYYEYWNEGDNMRLFQLSETYRRIGPIFQQFKGVSAANYYDVVAEVIYRAEHLHDSPGKLFYLIREAAKITGPFNRPPTNMKVWWARADIRISQDFIVRLRRVNTASNRRMIGAYEKAIIEKEEQLARMLHAGARIKAPRPKRQRQINIAGTVPEVSAAPNGDGVSGLDGAATEPEQT